MMFDKRQLKTSNKPKRKKSREKLRTFGLKIRLILNKGLPSSGTTLST